MASERTFRRLPADDEIVSGWDNVSRALIDKRFASGTAAGGAQSALQRNNMLGMDGPGHVAIRRLVASQFSRERIAYVTARQTKLARRLVERINRKPGPSELVRELVEPLVLDGIYSLMDVPVGYRRRLSASLRTMIGFLEPDATPELRAAARQAALGATLLLSRRWNNDGLQARLDEAVAANAISLELARTTPLVVLHGGYENPINMLGCVVDWAARNTGGLGPMPDDDAEALFEELVRLYSPVRAVMRRAATDVADYGPGFAQGDLVWMSLQSANEDPARFADPARVDPLRSSAHLGFGHGTHKCLGVMLARLEGVILLSALRRLPAERLAQLRSTWRDGFVARGLERAVLP